MQRRNNYAGALGVLLLIAAMLIAAGNVCNAAPTSNVNVVNTPNVNVINTPTVNLAPGGSVGITGTPTVQVGNTLTNPVPVRNVNDALSPFQQRLLFNIDPGSTQGQADINVPAGKRLVIEHISARAQGPVGQKFFGSILLHSGPGAELAVHFVVFNFQGTFGGIDEYTASTPLRAYADVSFPSSSCSVTRSDLTGFALVDLSISGYLVDAP
jgi:hypothetical protein